VKAGDTSILDQSEGRRPSIAVFSVKSSFQLKFELCL
jgi:hypothetical protein